MEDKKQISIKWNYKLTHLTDDLIKKLRVEKYWVWEGMEKAKKWIAWICRNYKWKYNLKQYEWHNQIVSLLRNAFASQIAWNTITPTFDTNIIALWNDFTTVTDDDIQLWAEFIRAEFESRYSVDNVAYLDHFFDASEVGWETIWEVGAFVDGDVGVTNDGFLFSKINVNEEMWADEQLSVNVSFTILW